MRFSIAALANVLLALVSFWILKRAHLPTSSESYLLVLFATAVSAATPIFSAPGQFLVLEYGARLPLVPLAAVAGVGSTLGELPAFWLGREGRGLGIVSRTIERAKPTWWWRAMERAGPWGLAAVAAIPNPVLDLVSIAAGISRMPLRHYLPAILGGRILRFLVIAAIGHRLGR